MSLSISISIAGAFVAFLAAETGPIAARTIKAGEVITPDHIETAAESAIEAGDPVLGKAVRRTVYAGQVISPENTMSPRLVTRNQVVTVRYIEAGLEITVSGRAMGEGGAGDAISVINADSRSVIHGVVTDEGWVLAQ